MRVDNPFTFTKVLVSTMHPHEALLVLLSHLGLQRLAHVCREKPSKAPSLPLLSTMGDYISTGWSRVITYLSPRSKLPFRFIVRNSVVRLRVAILSVPSDSVVVIVSPLVEIKSRRCPQAPPNILLYNCSPQKQYKSNRHVFSLFIFFFTQRRHIKSHRTFAISEKHQANIVLEYHQRQQPRQK